MMNLDFNHIRPINGTANDGFEEFVCQLARKEEIPCKKKYIRNGKPDGGVECYWILEDGSEVAWQAKYFCKAFDNSRYQQIDGSVKEALSSHPNLKRYIIALPTDPSDAHVEGRKSMKERIEGYVERWSKIKSDVTFEFWWATDIIERIQRPANQGMIRFWFGGNEFTDEDLKRFNTDSIKDLGKRYLPKLNVEVEPFEYFEVLSRGESFRHFLSEELKAVEDACGRIEKDKHCHDALDKVENVRNTIKHINETNVFGIDRIPLDVFLTALSALAEAVQSIAYKILEKEKTTYEESRISDRLYELSVDVLNVYNDLNQNLMRLINDPILILQGDAGVGKSHLIAEVVERREKAKQTSLLFLGQKFITDEDVFAQMMKMLYFNGTPEELLEMLEAKAETTGHRLIIYIDAINEGHGLNIWQRDIRSFIDRIRQHPWLGLVMSIRSSYIEAILPWDEYGYDCFVRAWHQGFGRSTQKAVQLYFKEYNILYPSVPLLNPEFRNPLFLHLFCEGMKNNGYRKIPDGIRGITSVMNLFFDGVEKSIRKDKRYSPSIRCVEKAVRKYIASTTKEGRHEIPIDKAIEMFADICPSVFSEGELMDCLVSEGVFSKNVFRKSDGSYGECIYLTYERFENVMQAAYLIDELQYDTNALEEYLQTVKILYRIGGLLESLATLLPERKGVELYDALPSFRDSKAMVHAVLSSLIWRDEKTIDARLDIYFAEFMDDDAFKERFIRTVIEIGFNSGNYYNADYLHKMLAPMRLADRDALWIPVLYRIYGNRENIVEDIINWVWDESDKVYIDDKSVELGATLLSWFLASTNRKLRDTATKALVQLLHNRMQLLIPIFEKFKAVDDPYIHERLYAVALGCAVRAKNKQHLVSLCQYIYTTVFDVEDEVYPHVLLRDYAREVIEYTLSMGDQFDIDVDRIRPPYKSSFDFAPVPNEEIKTLYEQCSGNKDCYGMYNMLTSMFTEHTTIGFSYGDFGRYTFQSALSDWKIDAEGLSNVAIKLIIEKYGYSEGRHGEFDKNVGSGRGRTTIPNERIGKKYQWLALHELLARVADNFPKLEYGWSENEVEYEGPWNPYVRDIDPTTLMRVNEDWGDTKSRDEFWWYGGKYANWDVGLVDWLNMDDDVPPVEPIIEVKDSDGCEWLALECYPEWDEPHGKDDIYKRLWYQVRSCIVDEEEFPHLYGWAENQNFGGRWMPENSEQYEVFYREYYWSPSYRCFDDDGLTKKEFYDRTTNKVIARAEVTSIFYLWEAGEDYSKERTYSFLIPSKQLFDGMKMQFADEEGVFENEEGKVICFDAGAIEKSKTYLLVRKDALLEYLKEHHKKIMWYVLGEKNIIGIHNYNSVPKLPMWLIVSGTYTLDENGRVVGSLRCCHEK